MAIISTAIIKYNKQGFLKCNVLVRQLPGTPRRMEDYMKESLRLGRLQGRINEWNLVVITDYNVEDTK